VVDTRRFIVVSFSDRSPWLDEFVISILFSSLHQFPHTYPLLPKPDGWTFGRSYLDLRTRGSFDGTGSDVTDPRQNFRRFVASEIVPFGIASSTTPAPTAAAATTATVRTRSFVAAETGAT
jgi:hypothetical protein